MRPSRRFAGTEQSDGANITITLEGTEELFRPAYDHLLIQEWMPALSCGTERLNAGIMVADIGCGNGASTGAHGRALSREHIHRL